jgi:transposase
MQGKVEQRAAVECDVGIDVCKAWLDVKILPLNVAERFPNTKKGFKALAALLKPHRIRRIVMEATGKLHRSVHVVLYDAGWAVTIVNPMRARLLAEALGLLAKTDKVDAHVLAVMAGLGLLATTPPLPEHLADLRELVRARSAAVAAKTALTNQLAAAALAAVRRQIKKQIKAASDAITALETEALEHAKTDPETVRRLALLTTIPGVGAITALGWLANLPELGTLTDKQAALLAGLAPIAKDSGQKSGLRHIRGGRETVRTGTYMAALSAIQHNPPLAAFYGRLIDAGKKKKVAVTAVMRKLIIIGNTLLKEDRPWSDVRPAPAGQTGAARPGNPSANV